MLAFLFMSLAPWRSPLSLALHRNRSLVYARYVQLATVRRDGTPANRTLVFRGFQANSDSLQFATDLRSAKVEHLGRRSQGEVCWYFPKTREQFRLGGSLFLVDEDCDEPDLQAERRSLWDRLSDAAQTQFTWATPGQTRDPSAELPVEVLDGDRPSINFCLLLLDPTYVDHLELRGDPQNRFIYLRYDSEDPDNEDPEWTIQSVNP